MTRILTRQMQISVSDTQKKCFCHIEDIHHLAEEDSPYPEVRAAVANTDDPEMPSNTLRVWVIGSFSFS